MVSKIWSVRLLHILLGITFLVGLLPISNHMLTMQAMHMVAGASSGNTTQEETGDYSAASCCEAIGSLLLACDFMVFQPVCAGPSGGSEKIAYSVLILQSIYIQILAPPPKA